jgi:hypothetical protein
LLNYSVTKRPDNFGTFTENNKNYYIGTNPFPQIHTISGLTKPTTTFGLPSGHSLTMIAFATFVTLDQLNDNNQFNPEHLPRYIMPWLFAFAVLWQRWFSRCYSPIQIFVRSLLGIGVGMGFFYLYKLTKKNY